MLKTRIRQAINALGYDVTKKPKIERGFQPSYLARLSQPSTVFDVGVGYGTEPLYQAYPKAKFILVEPLRDYESVIDKIAQNYDCEIVYKAVSDTKGVMEMTTDTEDLEKSSFQDRTSLTKSGNPLAKRQIPVTTLDDILEEHPGLESPILLKIDTEGHELAGLKGATRLLQITDTVIAEVSVAKRFENSYRFEDLILFMRQNGFYVFDFLTVSYADGELSPRFSDVVFKKTDLVGR